MRFVVLIVVGCAAPQRPAPPDRAPASWTQLDAIAASEVENHALVGLAVGVAYRGELVFAKGYGFEDREAQIPVVAEVTRFRWASVSKTVTSVLADQLVREGVLDWNASVATYFPSYAPASFLVPCRGTALEHARGRFVCADGFARLPLAAPERSVSVLALAGHLGGVMHYENGNGTPTPPGEFLESSRNTGMEAAVTSYLLGKPLVAPPRERFSYSTPGFNVLGVVLEKASRASFGSLIESRINAKVGTHVALDREGEPGEHRAVGYVMKDGVIERRGQAADVSWKAAGGGLISTVADLARYCAGLDTGALLSDAGKTVLWTSQRDGAGKPTGYGAGFNVGTSAGNRWAGHTGEQDKTRTSLTIYPDRRLCVVIMTNAEYANMRELSAVFERTALQLITSRRVAP
jgi:serine beta-lactamase-like protein LACTB, mitochondrial